MGRTHIISCHSCQGLLLVAHHQRTKTCPYCGSRIDAGRTRRLATAEDAFTASKMLRELKTKKRTEDEK